MKKLRFFFEWNGIAFFRGEGSDPDWDTPYPIEMDLLPLSCELKQEINEWLMEGERLYDPQDGTASLGEPSIDEIEWEKRQSLLFEKIKLELGSEYYVTMEH